MNKKYDCADCNKKYISYKSLWNHNKIHHNGIKICIENKPEIVEENNTTIEHCCRKCNKKYKHSQTRNCHEKKCLETKTSIEFEVEKMKQTTLDKEVEVEKMKQETKRIDVEALKLQIKLQGMKQIDNKTFKSINKVLKDRSTINNTMNNTIINNYHFPQITPLGGENVVETLSLQEKTMIIERKLCSLEKIVEVVHCGKYNMFKNILITNLKDKFAYRYDESKGYFITTTKEEVFDDLISNRMMDIEAIYDELSIENRIDVRTKKLIQELLDKMENGNVFVYGDVEYPNFKTFKMNNIKILLYNNRNKMTNDIALLIGDDKIPSIEPTNTINDIISK